MAGARERFISRREFIEIVGGGITSIIGIDYSSHAFNKFNQIRTETQREVEEQGTPSPDQGALKTAQQIRQESEEYKLKHRSPDEIRQATETEAQQARHDKEVIYRLSKKAGDYLLSSIKSVAGAVVAGYGGGEAVGELMNIFSRSRRR